MVQRFRIDAGAYIWMAFGLLLLPVSWILAAVVAAMIHEGCHYAAAKIRKVPCIALSVSSGGMVMHMGNMGRMDTVFVSAAGPAGSLLLGFLLRIWPQLAVCGIAQGIYNLLPIYPLDGGRIMLCLAGKHASTIEAVIVFLILLWGLILGICTKLRFYGVLLSLLIAGKAIQRKFPCKAGELGVQ